MKIEHVAVWTDDLERLKSFYQDYFYAVANEKYINSKTHFESYFLRFPGAGVRLELMYEPVLEGINHIEKIGWAHIAFSVGSKNAVDELTSRLKKDGFTIVDGPRVTGDGYYESCIFDPDGNRIEITG